MLKKHFKKIFLGIFLTSGLSAAIGGYLYFNSETYIKTLSWSEVSSKARQGHCVAQYLVGMEYIYASQFSRWLTEEDQKDYIRGVYWLERSAEQGYQPAQEDLVDFYIKAFKKTQSNDSLEQAKYWALKIGGKDKNNASDLGFIYIQQKDYEKAIEWYEKAGEAADLFELYNDASHPFHNAEKAAEKLLLMVDEAPSAGGKGARLYCLALIYQTGAKYCGSNTEEKGAIQPDQKKARKFMEQAAKLGNPEASRSIAYYYLYELGDGNLNEQKLKEALRLLEYAVITAPYWSYIDVFRLAELYETGKVNEIELSENLLLPNKEIDLSESLLLPNKGKATRFYKIACEKVPFWDAEVSGKCQKLLKF